VLSAGLWLRPRRSGHRPPPTYLLKKTWCAVAVASVDDTVLAVLANPDPTRPVSSALSVVRIAVAVVLYDSM